MKSRTARTVISLIFFAYLIHASAKEETKDRDKYNDGDDKYEDYEDDDDVDGDGEVIDQQKINSSQNTVDDLLQSDLYKFLDNIDEDALEEGRDSFIGRANKDTYCYIQDEEPYQYFSTKTQYPEYRDTRSLDPPPGCEVIYVWVMMRHGVRYGSSGKTYDYYSLGNFRDEIMKNAGKNKTELCLDDIFNFLLWMPKESEDGVIKPATLTESGFRLMRQMGKLLKDKFSHLIPKEYDGNQIKIQYSNEVKVNQSVETITDELFGKPIVPDLNDNLFDKVYARQCRKPDTRDKATGLNYTHLAETSSYTRQMVHDVSKRLGYDDDLTYRDVSKLYNGCQYEIAWGYNRSPWCAPFKKEDLQIMEYIGDISYFYFCGPGNVYNIFQGCVLLKDLVTKLIDAANGDSEEKLTLYLGHSTTVLFLITQLGLVQDGNYLTHENYHKLANRKWRTSLIAPYGGNVMAILHKCSTGYHVKFLLNQKPFIFQGNCDEETMLCPLEKIYKLFESIITSDECSTRYCNHTAEEMCMHLQYNEEECAILKQRYNEIKKKEEDERLNETHNLKTEDFYVEKLFTCSCIIVIISIMVFLTICCKLNRRLGRTFRRKNVEQNVTTEKDEFTEKDELEKETHTNEEKPVKEMPKTKEKERKRKPDKKNK